eukprot:183044-Alexandrium_andersonii.AAC.1
MVRGTCKHTRRMHFTLRFNPVCRTTKVSIFRLEAYACPARWFVCRAAVAPFCVPVGAMRWAPCVHTHRQRTAR